VLSIDANVALVELRGIAHRAANHQPVLRQIGQWQASKVMLGIMSEKDDPEGRPWAEWMPSTREQREKKGTANLGLLWDRGTLLGSITVQTGLHQVDIGTRMEEGAYLQHGTNRMEARPWLGWSDGDMNEAEQMFCNFLIGVPT
jgi:phage gpG-like protein